MLHAPKRGEVWQVDFSITQKVRPALGISMPFRDSDRALIGVIPHTTPIRGSQFEVPIPVPFLSEGAFLLQGIQAIPPKYFLRRLGVVPPSSFGSSSRPCCVGRGCKKPMRAANKITAANADGPCFLASRAPSAARIAEFDRSAVESRLLMRVSVVNILKGQWFCGVRFPRATVSATSALGYYRVAPPGRQDEPSGCMRRRGSLRFHTEHLWRALPDLWCSS